MYTHLYTLLITLLEIPPNLKAVFLGTDGGKLVSETYGAEN